MGKYATFSGRASRSEFWWFYLFTVLLGWGATAVGALSAPGTGAGEILSLIVSLALFLPTLAVGCRRLHDIGRSGWWQLLVLTLIGVILLIIWWATDTKREDNKYGSPAPAEVPAVAG